MAFDAYTTVEFVHVVAASVLVGFFALLPMWRASAQGTDAGVARHALDAMTRSQNLVVLPAAVALGLTGFLMVFGPLKKYDLFFARWALSGTVIWVVMLIVLLGGLAGATKKARPLLDGADPDRDAKLKKVWADWRTAVISGALLGVVGIAVMVFKPGV